MKTPAPGDALSSGAIESKEVGPTGGLRTYADWLWWRDSLPPKAIILPLTGLVCRV